MKIIIMQNSSQIWQPCYLHCINYSVNLYLGHGLQRGMLPSNKPSHCWLLIVYLFTMILKKTWWYCAMPHLMDWVQSYLINSQIDQNFPLHLLHEHCQQLNENIVRLRRRLWIASMVLRNSIPTLMVVIFVSSLIINHYYHYFTNIMPFQLLHQIEFGNGPWHCPCMTIP